MDAPSVQSSLSNQTQSTFADFDVNWPTSQETSSLASLIHTILLHPISSASLRRFGRQFIYESLHSPIPLLQKAHMPDPQAMCSPKILTWGRAPLTDCPLNPDKILESHQLHCTSCSPSCYIHRLVNVARCGWSLPRKKNLPVRGRRSNHSRFTEFDPASTVALETQILSSKACEPIEQKVEHSRLFHPLLTVIKNTDIWRAHEIGVVLDSAASLAQVNSQLAEPIKLRICLDTSCTGLNESQPDFPFCYTGIDEAISYMTPNCWMAKIDLKDMFHSLGLAYDSRRVFCFRDSFGTLSLQTSPFWRKALPCSPQRLYGRSVRRRQTSWYIGSDLHRRLPYIRSLISKLYAIP